MLTSLHLNEKSSELCIKTMLTPASTANTSQVTEHTTIKWPILRAALISFRKLFHWDAFNKISDVCATLTLRWVHGNSGVMTMFIHLLFELSHMCSDRERPSLNKVNLFKLFYLSMYNLGCVSNLFCYVYYGPPHWLVLFLFYGFRSERGIPHIAWLCHRRTLRLWIRDALWVQFLQCRFQETSYCQVNARRKADWSAGWILWSGFKEN